MFFFKLYFEDIVLIYFFKYLKLLEVACLENDVEAIRDILIDSGTGLNHDGNIVDYSFKGLVV